MLERRSRGHVGTCLFALIFVCGLAASSEARQSVVGALEGIDASGTASGWAADLTASSASIVVNIYLGGPAGGGGVFAGAIPASIPRGDIPQPGPHGFRFPVPTPYRDGQPHALYVYGVSVSGAATALLSQVPQDFTLSSTVIHLDNGVIRVGLEPRCGGTLVELRIIGRDNLINNADCTGRQIQPALYDGNDGYDPCAGCTGVWGWDPVMGGDRWNFGSPITSISVDAGTAYVQTRPYDWYPDNKGGGPGQPVLSDMQIEQWISFVADEPHVVRVHYRITHLGADTHANNEQEFPAVYVNKGYDTFISYNGTAPWTGGALTSRTLPTDQVTPFLFVPEHWSALVSTTGNAFAMYVPQQYSYVSGAQWSGTFGVYGSSANYVRPEAVFTFAPRSVLEGDVYLIADSYAYVRDTIYALHASVGTADALPPIGWLDSPASGQQVSGTVAVSGWAFDDTSGTAVQVFVDGTLAGTAEYGLPRPDVASVYPNAPSAVGFSYMLDTTRYGNGVHRVSVRATDETGHTAFLRKSLITTQNEGDTIPPMVAITGTTYSARTLTVTVSASDNVGVTKVELYVDDTLVGTATGEPYTFQVRWRRRGTHTLVARAYDAAGNVATSSPVSFTR